jgi:hypothetical protein
MFSVLEVQGIFGGYAEPGDDICGDVVELLVSVAGGFDH